MENSSDHRSRVRKYRKSSSPRLRWTPELHDHFVQTVQKLGGKYKATPKKIMQMMGVRGLQISHVKSHLQMYRNMKESNDPNGFIAINSYQENNSDCITLLPLRELSQGLRQVKGQFGTCHGNRRKIAQNDEKLLCRHEFEEKKGSTGRRKRDGEIPRANNIVELPLRVKANSIKTSSECMRHHHHHHPHINLDLTLQQYIIN